MEETCLGELCRLLLLSRLTLGMDCMHSAQLQGCSAVRRSVIIVFRPSIRITCTFWSCSYGCVLLWVYCFPLFSISLWFDEGRAMHSVSRQPIRALVWTFNYLHRISSVAALPEQSYLRIARIASIVEQSSFNGYWEEAWCGHVWIVAYQVIIYTWPSWSLMRGAMTV